jgi:hypothetical protein
MKEGSVEPPQLQRWTGRNEKTNASRFARTQTLQGKHLRQPRMLDVVAAAALLRDWRLLIGD